MRQAECVSDSIYKSRCLKRLRELGLPTEGWVCEWIEDTDEPEAVCELWRVCPCAIPAPYAAPDGGTHHRGRLSVRWHHVRR